MTPTANRRNLLQTFRAFQALAETGPVTIRPEEKPWWDYAAQWFNLRYTVEPSDPSVVVEVDHDQPLTRIGSNERPLIYPHQFFDLYRRAWGKRTGALFIGAISPTRLKALDGWDAVIVESTRGRRWPVKAWDPDYVEQMGHTAYALCPVSYFSPKVLWTYRFFDACAAGAIPVVNQVSPLYEGFTYGTWDHQPEWTLDAAEANFDRVRNLFTLDAGALAP